MWHKIPDGSFGRSGMTAWPSVVVDHHRPHLDRTGLGAGNSRRNANRGVEVLGLDQIIAAELLAGFGKWAIGCEDLAVAHAHGGGRRRRLQSVAGLEMAALDDGLGECTVVRHHLFAIGLARFAEFGFVSIDQQQILHGLLLSSASSPINSRTGRQQNDITRKILRPGIIAMPCKALAWSTA